MTIFFFSAEGFGVFSTSQDTHLGAVIDEIILKQSELSSLSPQSGLEVLEL